MKNDVSISRYRVRGAPRWVVRWHDAGRVRRKYFTGRDPADAHAASLRGDAVSSRLQLGALAQDTQEQLLLIVREADRLGLSLLAITGMLAGTAKGTSAPAIEDVLTEMLNTKTKAGRAQDYLRSLRAIVETFIRGRERLPVDGFMVRDLEIFLDSKNIRSRSTLRARLSTLFKFAVRRGYRTDNPCAALESISRSHQPPAILTIDETKKCLRWLSVHPRLLGWFALSTFAGLRPEEAQKSTWRDINFDEGWIRVEAQTTKVRQRRVVYPPAAAIAWLQRAKKLGSLLPLTTKQRNIELRSLRRVLNWPKWKQDVTRHSAASYWLAHSGSAATVATALGHSEAILRKNYMALVTRSDAEKFWAAR